MLFTSRRRPTVRGNKLSTTPETLYARAKTAEWLLYCLERNIVMDSQFFDCLRWVSDDLRRPLQAVMTGAKNLSHKTGIVKAREAVKDALKRPADRLAGEFEDLVEEHPCLGGVIADVVTHGCTVARAACRKRCEPYATALKRLEQVFGISRDSQIVCEFLFINQNFGAVESFFEDMLEVFAYGNRPLLAHMLGLSPARLRACLDELFKCGLIDTVFSSHLRLKDFLLPFWESDSLDPASLFSRPLKGRALPLDAFQVPAPDAEYARRLLVQEGDAPVHILLYGSPGTGKSSFAHSLARACGVKAWAAVSREDDDDGGRRAALAACLHMAAGHKGAFVLVDEAERLLDTDFMFGRKTKDKAWLNDFLEQPGNRVVWITNQVGHIDPAVLRRFSFSIHFETLGVRERGDIWRQVLARHKAAKWLGEEDIQDLVAGYPVETAVIEGVVSRARTLCGRKKDFRDTLELALRSHLTLQHGGRKTRPKPRAVSDFTLDGVSLEGSAADLLARSRRVDAALRDGVSLRPGCATMLFYGPPGTGKTALARHIAEELGRECIVQRASDLLSPYVGVAEQQVAAAFARAEREGAVLVVDEADSFLYSRDIAHRSWETSLVNEFLTALEECRGFCICTTNRRDTLDAAAMRRFSHKVAFSYARPDQVRALYAGLLAPLCAEPLPASLEDELVTLARLTPGDFHAVRSQYDSLFEDTSDLRHATLVAALAKEQALKTEPRRIGFGT